MRLVKDEISARVNANPNDCLASSDNVPTPKTLHVPCPKRVLLAGINSVKRRCVVHHVGTDLFYYGKAISWVCASMAACAKRTNQCPHKSIMSISLLEILRLQHNKQSRFPTPKCRFQP